MNVINFKKVGAKLHARFEAEQTVEKFFAEPVIIRLCGH